VYLFILPFAHTISIRWTALVFGIVATIRYRSVATVPKIPCKLPITLWVVVASMSLVWAIDFQYSFGQFRIDVLYAVATFLVFFILTAGFRELGVLLWSLWASAIVISTIAIIIQIRYGAWIAGYQNFFGEFTSCMLMSISIIPMLLLLDREHRTRSITAILVAMIMIVIACFFARQRTFWIALVVMIALTGFMYFPFASRRARILIAIGTVMLVVTSALGFLAVSKMRKVDIESDHRPVIWAQALKNIHEHPFTGGGFGREVYKPRYLPLSRPGLETLPHSHNVFLSYAEQMGIQGTVALITLFLALLVRFVRFSRLNDVNIRAVGIAGAALVVSTVVRGMTDMHFSREVTLFFWANIGMLLGYGERVARSLVVEVRSTSKHPRNIPQWWNWG
jgi:O-antigen ligase